LLALRYKREFACFWAHNTQKQANSNPFFDLVVRAAYGALDGAMMGKVTDQLK